MHLKTPAFFLISLCAVPGVVRAENRPHFPGATLTLLVLYSGIFEVDAAPSKLFRTLSNLFQRRNKKVSTDNDGTLERPEEKYVITPEVKRYMRTMVLTYTLQTLVSGNTAGLNKGLQLSTIPSNFKGQGGIRKALLWRSPVSPGSSGLDGICKEGETLKFFSTLDDGYVKVTRTPRMDNNLLFMNIKHPEFGTMTLRTVILPISEATDPLKAVPFLSLLESSINLPAPLSKRLPIEVQNEFGLLATMDIFRLPGTHIPRDPDVPGHVVYNMFLLHTPIECSMEDLIRVLNEDMKESTGGTPYQARLSMTVQALSILSNLRKEELVPSRVDAGSFVVTPTGDVLLADFAPLLAETRSYVLYPDGVIARNKQVSQKKKKGFRRFSDGGKDATPYEVNTSQPDEDAANLLLQIWCPLAVSGLGGTEAAAAGAESLPYPINSNTARTPAPFLMSSSSEESNSSPDAEPGRASSPAPSPMSTSSDEEGAAGQVNIDWAQCPGVPHEVQRIFDGLNKGYIKLADLTLLHDFQELCSSARAPPRYVSTT